MPKNERLPEKAGKAFSWKIVEQGGAKFIFLVRLLVLARLLTPDDFGLYAIALVATNTMAGATSLGMIPALVQRQQLNALHYHGAWTVGVIRASLIAGIAFLFAPTIAHLFQDERAVIVIQAVALRPLIESLASIRLADLIRNLQFRSLAILKLSEAVANTLIAVLLAHSFGVWALVGGTLAGPAALLMLSYVFAPYSTPACH